MQSTPFEAQVHRSSPQPSRRSAIGQTLALFAAGYTLRAGVAQESTTPTVHELAAIKQSPILSEFKIQNRRVRQSVMGWCYKPMPIPDLIDLCVNVGLEGIEGIDTKFYPLAREKGLKIALVGSHGFGTGPVHPDNHAECVDKLTKAIDTAAEFGSKSVITFTGMRVPGMTDQVADQNCLDCWKKVIKHAESKNITLVLEHLNSRDDTHPMKGHPGYYGDDVDHCIDLIRRMDSPNFKLLFDIYHVQIMNGDVIRRIQQYHSLIGHYHTAGCPGRAEMDETQEINYQPILEAILRTGYQAFIAQEFIPTWSNPNLAFRHGAKVMDV
jgi:hydroxypyruvate isomerase